MSYQLQSIQSVLAGVNKANGLVGANALKPTDVTFSEPKVVAGTWQEQATTHNTAVRLTNTPEALTEGTQTILYDRLDIASLKKIKGFKIAAPTPQKTYDVLDSIAYFTGVKFLVDDLENLNVVYNDGVGTVVLSAKPTSIGWFGNASFEVSQGGASIDKSITVVDLPGLNYPTPNPGVDVFGSVYLYGYDFTTHVSRFLDIVPGALSASDATYLVAALKAMDVSVGKALWTASGAATTYDLGGATVTFNGLNDTTKPTNPAYKYVLGLTLREGVTTPAGVMYLHYNDPFNPNEF